MNSVMVGVFVAALVAAFIVAFINNPEVILMMTVIGVLLAAWRFWH